MALYGSGNEDTIITEYLDSHLEDGIAQKNLDFILRLQLTSKCKYDKLQLPKASKRKFDL